MGLVRVIEGYVKEIKAHVPWMALMEESSTIIVKGLELTFAPLQVIDTFNTQELVSSMIGSIVSSMARSVEEIIQEDLER